MVPRHPSLLPGLPHPLGATIRDGGVNFALYSRDAESVHLCLFEDTTGPEVARVKLPSRTGHVRHGFLPGAESGLLYGYRVEGPYDPPSGLRFNAAKLLIDPYTKVLAGAFDWSQPLRGSDLDGTIDIGDSAPGVPRSMVYQDSFDWQGVQPPGTPMHETVIYETHVKGFSHRNPAVPPEIRGTFLGLAHEASIQHLQSLGITAVELLPVHARADRERMVRLGLTNYWGYDTIAFFAPDARFSSAGDRGQQIAEFKTMVRELHRQGIEVILDVVYNHTPEGDETGPTLSLRGIDNATYYSLDPNYRGRYINRTGTGNTLRTSAPVTLRLVMDSLRYWVQEMHVDGFRFDLAAALVRDGSDPAAQSAFLEAVHQDPVLSKTKLIAEPWFVGPHGYMAGQFPPPWSEWNDKFRDAVRHYWRGDESKTPELAYRLTGSSDVHGHDGRSPQASINYVTAHDGFTLEDLVSYTAKRNLVNGEANRDGSDYNLSWNHGMEGPSSVPAIIELRERQKRNFLATLLFSQGVPMLLGGDELGRTQRGNNNAYNQDNDISWYNWELNARQKELFEFTSRLIAVRRGHPSLRRRGFLDGRPTNGSGLKDVLWLRPNGNEMTAQDWQAPWLRSFGLRLDGHLDEMGPDGNYILDDSLLLLLNSSDSEVAFTLPEGEWRLVIDTAQPAVMEDAQVYGPGQILRFTARSLLLLRQPTAPVPS